MYGVPITLVFACDDTYAQHAHVAITSVIRYNVKHKLRVFILVPIEFKYEKLMEDDLGQQCELVFIRVPAEMIGSVKVTGHISETAYFRILIGDLLPPSIHRVIYLDCDLIVSGDIEPLWSIELGDKIVGAVPDAIVKSDENLKYRLGLQLNDEYFNSGVMLINLKQWRNLNIGAQVMDFCHNRWDLISYWDQCALNYIFRANYLVLDENWNSQQWYLSKSGKLKKNLIPTIVHFVTGRKPWLYDHRPPMAHLYWKVLRLTPWRNYKPPGRTPSSFVRKWGKILAPEIFVNYRRIMIRRKF